MSERVTPEELRRVAEDWDVGYDRSEPEGYLVVALRAAADTIEELTAAIRTLRDVGFSDDDLTIRGFTREWVEHFRSLVEASDDH